MRTLGLIVLFASCLLTPSAHANPGMQTSDAPSAPVVWTHDASGIRVRIVSRASEPHFTLAVFTLGKSSGGKAAETPAKKIEVEALYRRKAYKAHLPCMTEAESHVLRCESVSGNPFHPRDHVDLKVVADGKKLSVPLVFPLTPSAKKDEKTSGTSDEIAN